jgi:hypothetical protein
MVFITGSEARETLLKMRLDDFPKGSLQSEVLALPFDILAMISSRGKEWRWHRSATALLFSWLNSSWNLASRRKRPARYF